MTDYEYELAVENNVAAARRFRNIRNMYRKHAIDYKEFIAKWEEYKSAEAEFDAAFAKKFPR